jgi:hypothetical protein
MVSMRTQGQHEGKGVFQEQYELKTMSHSVVCAFDSTSRLTRSVDSIDVGTKKEQERRLWD